MIESEVKKLIYYFHVNEGKFCIHTGIKKAIELKRSDIHNSIIYFAEHLSKRKDNPKSYLYRRIGIRLICISESSDNLIGYICVYRGIAYYYLGRL